MTHQTPSRSANCFLSRLTLPGSRTELRSSASSVPKTREPRPEDVQPRLDQWPDFWHRWPGTAFRRA